MRRVPPSTLGSGKLEIAAPASSEVADQLGQLVGADAPALFEPHRLVRLAVLQRPVAGARRVAGAAGLVGEGEDHRQERFSDGTQAER
ncbi:protein of unknown function [Methylorubrum extorquens]|uniref:Uncharacterized protein n=1 Tax=Methylorubrum extorquens TaxID=408 RepID=A0A2N9AKU6_METEX|nr:protein of unknown function [Methylorubrum extorquens]